MQADHASVAVVVPAYNEAAVIGDCLRQLVPGLDASAFRVIVVANGCVDDTAAVAASVHSAIEVIAVSDAGKANALTTGSRRAGPGTVVYLDADLVPEPGAIERLVQPLLAGRALAACGTMLVDTRRASAIVRAFYRVWALNPYFDHGKFGGLFALAPAGRARVGSFAKRIADDEYARRAFAQDEIAFVPSCRFTARAPETLRALLAVRRRSRRGTVQLAGPAGRNAAPLAMARRVAARPRLWTDALVYLALTLLVRVRVAAESEAACNRWERDDSTRAAA